MAKDSGKVGDFTESAYAEAAAATSPSSAPIKVRVINSDQLSDVAKNNVKEFLISSMPSNIHPKYRADVKWRTVTFPVNSPIGEGQGSPQVQIIVTTGCAPRVNVSGKNDDDRASYTKAAGSLDADKYKADYKKLVKGWLQAQDDEGVHTVLMPLVGCGSYYMEGTNKFAAIQGIQQAIAEVILEATPGEFKNVKRIIVPTDYPSSHELVEWPVSTVDGQCKPIIHKTGSPLLKQAGEVPADGKQKGKEANLILLAHTLLDERHNQKVGIINPGNDRNENPEDDFQSQMALFFSRAGVRKPSAAELEGAIDVEVARLKTMSPEEMRLNAEAKPASASAATPAASFSSSSAPSPSIPLSSSSSSASSAVLADHGPSAANAATVTKAAIKKEVAQPEPSRDRDEEEQEEELAVVGKEEGLGTGELSKKDPHAGYKRYSENAQGMQNDCAEVAVETAAFKVMGLNRYMVYPVAVEADEVDITYPLMNIENIDAKYLTKSTDVNLATLDRNATYMVRTGIVNGSGHWQILHCQDGQWHRLDRSGDVPVEDKDFQKSFDAGGSNYSIYMIKATPNNIALCTHYLFAYRNTPLDVDGGTNAKEAHANQAVQTAIDNAKGGPIPLHEAFEDRDIINSREQEALEQIKRTQGKQEQKKQVEKPVETKTKATKGAHEHATPAEKAARWGTAEVAALAQKPGDFTAKRGDFWEYLKKKKFDIEQNKEKYNDAKKWAETGDATKLTDSVKTVLTDIEAKAKVYSALAAQKMDATAIPAEIMPEIKAAKTEGKIQVVVMAAVAKGDREVVRVYDDPNQRVFRTTDEMKEAINTADVKIMIKKIEYSVESRKSPSKPETNLDFYLVDPNGVSYAVTAEHLRDYAEGPKRTGQGASLSEEVMRKTKAYMNEKMPQVYVYTQARQVPPVLQNNPPRPKM